MPTRTAWFQDRTPPAHVNGINYPHPQSLGLMAWYDTRAAAGTGLIKERIHGQDAVHQGTANPWIVDRDFGPVPNFEFTLDHFLGKTNELINRTLNREYTITWWNKMSRIGQTFPNPNLFSDIQRFMGIPGPTLLIIFDVVGEFGGTMSYFTGSTSNNSALVSSAGVILANKWQFLSVQHDPNPPGPRVRRIFIDGVLDTTKNGGAAPNASLVRDVLIGADAVFFGGGQGFLGRCHDIRIYNRLLTEKEMQEMKASGPL